MLQEPINKSGKPEEASPPAWTRGHPLGFLRAIAALFRAELKPHSYGAFGVPNERDIADAHSEGGLIWTRDRCLDGEPFAAAALLRRLKSPSAHEDFAGRIARPQAGDILIRAIAGSAAGKRRILERLLERGAAKAVWVEGHVENNELVALLGELGFHRAMTKIMGSSDLKGLWLRCEIFSARQLRLPPPLDPADEPALMILRPDFISEEERLAVLAEAEEFASWADHYSGYNKRHSWSAFALRGFDATDPSFIEKPAEMSRAWKKENPERLGAPCRATIACHHFPAANAICDRIPGAKQRVRLMRLAPKGGELTRHADIIDPEAGTGPGKIARLHIPILTSPACSFQGWGLDGRKIEQHFPERALCYLDTRKPHAAKNAGAVERIHLVIDCFVGSELRAMIGGPRPLFFSAGGDYVAARAKPGIDRLPVKISAKMARLAFTQCGPDCIEAHGCKGNCCFSSSHPSGTMIAIADFEREHIERLGGKIEGGLLQPRPGEKRCPFIRDGLCSLHGEGGPKPFGCTASPFTLNRSGTLIVRNRYRVLPCFKPGGPKSPAYVAFRSSLDRIFGLEESARICAHLDAGGGDITGYMPRAHHTALLGNDANRRKAKSGA